MHVDIVHLQPWSTSVHGDIVRSQPWSTSVHSDIVHLQLWRTSVHVSSAHVSFLNRKAKTRTNKKEFSLLRTMSLCSTDQALISQCLVAQWSSSFILVQCWFWSCRCTIPFSH